MVYFKEKNNKFKKNEKSIENNIINYNYKKLLINNRCINKYNIN